MVDAAWTYVGELVQEEVDVFHVDKPSEQRCGDDYSEEVAPREEVHRGDHLFGLKNRTSFTQEG